MSKSKENIGPKQVLDYLMEQNRPFSINDIFTNMRIDCGKTAMTRVLEQLVSEQKVKEKTYGKQKIYFINQSLFANSKDGDVQSMDGKIIELSNSLNGLHKQIKLSEDKLGGLDQSLTTETAEAELIALKNEIPVFKDKLNSFETKSGHIDPNEKKMLHGTKEKYLKEYSRRKRLANNIIDAILEGYPKSKKQLLEELGVEADGDLKL